MEPRGLEPGPVAFFLYCGQFFMSSGPWQPLLLTCEPRTAGVASVISAVEIFPVRYPCSLAISRMVLAVLSVPAVVEIRPLLVFRPVAHAVPPAAESVT